MEQLTTEQAIAFAESGAWKELDNEQIVRFQLFQSKLCMPFTRFHEAIEKVLDRPVYTHEFGLNLNGIKEEYLKTKQSPTLEEIINLIPKEKRMVIGI